MRALLPVLCIAAIAVGCSTPSATPGGKPAPAAAPKLGIRADGDTEIKPDLSKIDNEDLKKVFAYIDQHIDEHVQNLQKWIRQPSISNSGEGIPESAEMVKGFFEQLGCQESRVYDVGITEWGAPGNPVVYARCDEGAPRTIAIYWQYDTLPVNIVFVAEGDEERMDVGVRKFVKDHPDFFKNVDALIGEAGQQSASGAGTVGGGSAGCVYFELTTSGKSWGRGHVQSHIHGSNKRSVDSPAWRHMKMLAYLVSADGNTPLVKGFTDGIEPLSASETAQLKNAAAKTDLKVAAQNLGVARFISDDPFTMLKMGRYGITVNLDGIWGGNMYAGGAGAILPNKITSKHNIRYVPKMKGLEIVKRVREQLDRNGYKDVELKVIGDVPWSKMSYDTDIARAMNQMYDQFSIPHAEKSEVPTILGGYWPSYLFSNQEVGERVAPVFMFMVRGGAGYRVFAYAAILYY